VPDTTPPNFGIAPPPTTQPSTNPLFTAAERLVPNAKSTVRVSEYSQVLAPFTARAFARGIEASNADIGPMAIAETPEGDVLVSGGPTRGWIYRFSTAGGDALTPWAEESYPIFNLAFDAGGRLWATTGGGPLLELSRDTGAVLGQYGDGITMAMAIEPSTGLIYVAKGAVWSGGVNGVGGGVEVFDPATAPVVVATSPPAGSVVALPLSQIAITFDQDMFVGQGLEPGSVTNPASYVLNGRNTGPVPFNRVFYVAQTRTVFLS